MRRVVCVGSPAVVLQSHVRTYWSSESPQGESLFLDRKDLDQMYPTKKPWVTAGEYGYNRHIYYGCTMHANPVIRMPHMRRRLNPKKSEVVTVYGATGFLGTNIVRELLAHPKIKKCVLARGTQRG